jgi:succinate dehydrogenase / fumarate reductase cytochrome b subunit
MADVNRGNRPLSPFMIGPYYRPQMTSISSILVRITGIASLGVALLIVAWLVAAASSEAAFAVMDGLLRSWLGDLIMLLATWAIWYHMLGRLRHLLWDLGYGLNIPTAEKMGLGMFIVSTAMTIFTVIAV